MVRNRSLVRWGRWAAVAAAALLLLGCGDDDGGSRPAPTPTPVIAGEEDNPFDLSLALELGLLSLEAYQMLTDYENHQSFTLPSPYVLQKQFLTSEPFAGEILTEAVPIAYIATSGDTIYVVFRGTKTIAEWIADAMLSQVPYTYVSGSFETETGFTGVYETIRDEIVAEVNRLAADTSYSTLYVTGHSLGAALATLAAPDLARATGFAAPVLYNFASPRVGNPTFAAMVDELPTSWRVVNTNDEVPTLPHPFTIILHDNEPEFFFYEHIDSEYAITFGEPIRNLTDLAENHEMCNYYAALCDQTSDPAGCKAMAEGLDGCMPS